MTDIEYLTRPLQDSWAKIEDLDLELYDRVPILLFSAEWHEIKGKRAFGYYDKHLGWNITVFEGASAYAMVDYHSSRFKPTHWMDYPDIITKTYDLKEELNKLTTS